MSLRAKAAKLVNHPAFRHDPAGVLARAASLALHVAAGREPTVRLTRHGERLRVPADLRFTTVSAVLLRDWAEPELRALDRFLRPGDCFVDVGANIGLFALKAARLVGSAGRVVAVEPGRVSADRLEANVALNGFTQIAVVREAVSDREGFAGLHHIALGDDPQAFSLLPDGSAVAAETVPTTTLDRLAERLGLDRLDCIKIDVEGAEPMVVAGGAAVLARFRPAVIFEVNAPPALKAGNAAEAADGLVRLGFRLHRLDGGALVPVDGIGTAHGNLVALPPG